MPLSQRPSTCSSCPLYTLGSGFCAEPEGQGTLGVLVLGESLGEQEANASAPFRPYAPAGSILERAIKRAGLTREQLALYNVCNCKPPGKNLEGTKYERAAVESCRQYVHRAVDKYRPRVILALGGVALRATTGYAGKDCGIQDLRGFILPSREYNLPVISCVPEDTECLTARGWRRRDELIVGELVAAQNPEGLLNWEPLEKIHTHWDQKTRMLRVQGRCLDMFVSSKHRCVVKREKPRKWPNKPREYFRDIILAEDLIDSDTISLAAPWTENQTEQEISPELAEILGWYIAEGTPHAGGARIYQSKKANLKYCKRIEALLLRLGQYSVRESRPGSLVFGLLGDLGRRVRQLCPGREKAFPTDFLKWSRPVLLAFYTGLVLGDGSLKSVTHNEWHQKSTQHLADFQALCARLGWVSSLQSKNGYRNARTIGVYKGERSKWRGIKLSKTTWEDFEGTIWCPQTPSGTWVARRNGKVFITGNSFHPSFIRRGNSKLLGVLIRDLKLAVSVAQDGIPAELPQQYSEVPSLQEARDYLAFLQSNPSLPIAYDIETDYSTKSSDESDALSGTGNNITQIQFSHKPGQAIIFQWQGEYIEIAKAILALSNDKIGHNALIFDNQKLRLAGVLVAGKIWDTMWLWHHLQPDLPKKLQFVTSFYAPDMKPWKHLASSDMTFYGGCDVDSLQRIFPPLLASLKAENLLESYEKYVAGLWPCLEKMSLRGIPLNIEKRASFASEIDRDQKEVYDHIQRVATELNPTLIKLHPEQGYATKPKDTTGMVVRSFNIQIPTLVTCGVCEGRGSIEGKRKGSSKQCPKCKRKGSIPSKTERTAVDVGRFCRLLGFNPDSPIQLFEYMRLRRHPIPTDRDGKRTSDDTALERLLEKTGDEFYALVKQYRGLGKIKETYLEGEGWAEAGTSGRVHSDFTFGPATGQLASKNPNIQNIPKHGELAAKFRTCISSGSDHRLVELDFSGFHALTLGFEAEDESYMRLARLDPHSFLAGQFLRLPGHETWLSLSDSDLQEQLAYIKKNHKDVRDQKAKPAMHGYGFGMGGHRLYRESPESFGSVKEAQYILDLLDRTFPKIPAYRAQVRAEAHSKAVLRTRYDFIRRFYDVYSWSQQTGGWRPGEQYNEVVAFQPANDAFGKVRDVMLALEDRGLNEKYGFILNNHDSLLFECPVKLVDECLEVVSTELESPASRLVNSVAPLGLRCGVEAKVGKNWLEMETAYSTPLERVM